VRPARQTRHKNSRDKSVSNGRASSKYGSQKHYDGGYARAWDTLPESRQHPSRAQEVAQEHTVGAPGSRHPSAGGLVPDIDAKHRTESNNETRRQSEQLLLANANRDRRQDGFVVPTAMLISPRQARLYGLRSNPSREKHFPRMIHNQPPSETNPRKKFFPNHPQTFVERGSAAPDSAHQDSSSSHMLAERNPPPHPPVTSRNLLHKLVPAPWHGRAPRRPNN